MHLDQEQTDAWLVHWTLQGRPQLLPWDMLATIPVEAFGLCPGDECYFGSCDFGQATIWPCTDTADYDVEVYDDRLGGISLSAARGFLVRVRTWVARWQAAGQPQALTTRDLVTAPDGIFATHKKFWTRDNDIVVERYMNPMQRPRYRVLCGLYDPAEFEHWRQARHLLMARVRNS